MGGFEDHIAITGDWMPPSLNPRSFFSSILSDEMVAGSDAEPSFENKSGSVFSRFEGPIASGSNEEPTKANVECDGGVDSIMPPKPKVSSRGKLVERMAARAGFNAPRLNTESIRPPDLPKNSDAQSHFFMTNPAGLSPTTLLDSPVFLNNSLVLPSPTTGKFSFAPGGNNRNSEVVTDDSDQGKKNAFQDNSSLVYKPITESGYTPYFETANKVNASELAPWSFHGGVSVHSDASYLHQNLEPPSVQVYVNLHAETNEGSNHRLELADCSVGVSENSPPRDEPNGDDGDQSSGDPIGSPSDDGYNWRKYGQKQVKGSEYPRSYYKCTHANCPVKKKVERSQEGHITEIIYKGIHNHPKPPPNRRPSIGSSTALTDMHQLEPEIPGRGANGDTIWSTMQRGNGAFAFQWSHDNPEATSSEQLPQEYSNGGPLRPQNGSQVELGDGVDGSCTLSNDEDEDEDEDERATHGSVSLGYDGEGDESESKIRRIETYAREMGGGATRAIREQRVVVQTASEVDILDDGYRWRKYGQKVVKGNPNPRSYYKCTSAGCNVRKHVERASHDLKSVLTTYEGKHNHDVPAARNSSHVNSGGSNTHLNQQSPSLTVSGHIHRPEPSQLHNSTARFGRAGLGAFGLTGRQQMGPGPGYGFGLNHPGITNLGLAGLGHIQGKFPVHAYLGHQPRPIHDMSFMMPKTEPKLEPVTDHSGLHSYDGNSVYQQFMSRLPLGP